MLVDSLSLKVERPDVAMGIHPGLHADGVFEFWEPTLDLLLDENIVTVFTMFSQEEYEMSLVRLDGMFAKYDQSPAHFQSSIVFPQVSFQRKEQPWVDPCEADPAQPQHDVGQQHLPHRLPGQVGPCKFI